MSLPEFSFSLDFLIIALFRSVVAVIIGGLIGSERARHGRAAGMRTHILVCLGAALTSMISVYVGSVLGNDGDVLRISAQVISGIGFLGAGMIILKNNSVITGLTTAAGVWTTSVIGIAVGFGFYEGAVTVTVLFLATIILFAKLERRKKSAEAIYIEIDDMYKTNQIVGQISERLESEFHYHVVTAKSGAQGHLGIHLVIQKRQKNLMSDLLGVEHVVFVSEED